MFCNNCGHQNPDNQSQCINCGAPLQNYAPNQFLNPASPSTPKKKLDVAAIIGIIAGAVALVAVVIIILLFALGGNNSEPDIYNNNNVNEQSDAGTNNISDDISDFEQDEVTLTSQKDILEATEKMILSGDTSYVEPYYFAQAKAFLASDYADEAYYLELSESIENFDYIYDDNPAGVVLEEYEGYTISLSDLKAGVYDNEASSDDIDYVSETLELIMNEVNSFLKDISFKNQVTDIAWDALYVSDSVSGVEIYMIEIDNSWYILGFGAY